LPARRRAVSGRALRPREPQGLRPQGRAGLLHRRDDLHEGGGHGGGPAARPRQRWDRLRGGARRRERRLQGGGLQEDQVPHARERGLRRGAVAGDADAHQRLLAHRPRGRGALSRCPASGRGGSPAGPFGRAAHRRLHGTHVRPARSRTHHRQPLRRGRSAEEGAGWRAGLRSHHLPLRPDSRRGGAGAATLRGAGGAAAPGPSDDRGLRVRGWVPGVHRTAAGARWTGSARGLRGAAQRAPQTPGPGAAVRVGCGGAAVAIRSGDAVTLKRKLSRLSGVGPGGVSPPGIPRAPAPSHAVPPAASPVPEPSANALVEPEASSGVGTGGPLSATPPSNAPEAQRAREEKLRRHLAELGQRRRPVVSEEASAPKPLAQQVESPYGPLWMRESLLAEDHHHGRAPVRRVLELEAAWVADLALDPSLAGLPLEDLLLFDTETTGLAGGTGTLPFVVGLGWFEAGRLR